MISTAERQRREIYLRAQYPRIELEQIEIISGLSEGLYEVWEALASAGAEGMCRKCLDEKVKIAIGGNGSSTLRNLRNCGFSIPPASRGQCPKHGNSTSWDYLKDPMPKLSDVKQRASYSKNEMDTIRRIIGDRDAYTGIKATEIDHRVPFFKVSGQESRVNLDDPEEVRSRYMPLSGAHNALKRDACASCDETGDRTVFMGIPFWFSGERKFNDSVGCRGCAWAYPEEWQEAIIKRIAES